MRREDLADLTIFMAVVDEGGFTRAAKKLSLSQSAISHTLRRLETRLGLRLLTRTTRSVAPTQAGERLLEALRPAFDTLDEKLSALSQLREKPAGTIRISTSEHAAETILWPVVDRLTREHPDIHVELNIDAGLTDIVTERFDAGVRLGENLDKDMIALRIGPRLRMAAVGSPAYFAAHGVPQTPQDLHRHRCINLRLATAGGLYAWEFEQNGREIRIKVEGQLTFNRVPIMLKAAIAGHGICFVPENQVAGPVAEGTLQRVLEPWCDPFDGYHLYYPSRRQVSPAFRLLVEALRYRG